MKRHRTIFSFLLLSLPITAPVWGQSTDLKPGRPGAPASDIRPEEQQFADLAVEEPSSAGFYYDSTGEMVVLVRDAARDAAVLGKVRGAVDAQRLLGPGGGKPASRIKVARAKYTFWQLAAWRDLAFDNVLGQMEGVIWLDLDEVANRVTLGITDDHFVGMQGPVREKLRSLGVDPAAVAFKKVGQHGYDQGSPPGTINQQTSDPIAGGLDMLLQHNDGSWGACTIGFAAQRNGVAGIVSNSHCTTFMFNPDTDPVYQLYPRQIATASVDPNAYTCGFRRCRGADAVFFSTTNVAPMGVGLIARTTAPNSGGLGGGAGSRAVDPSRPYWYVTGEEQENLWVGQRVDKVGATTGWTYGNVTATCVDHQPDGNSVMRCAYEADYAADHGDSGGPVFVIDDWQASRVTLAGIHSGRDDWHGIGSGRARFAKLARIKSDLGGTWVVKHPSPPPPTPPPPQPLSASISGPSAVAGGQTYTWTAMAGGGTPPYTYQWGGPVSGTNVSTSGSLWSSDVIGLTVWDATGASVYSTLYVTVCPDGQITCEPY